MSLAARSAARPYENFANSAQEAHPDISTGSNLIGAVLPAFFGDEAGLAGLTPAGFTARIGSRIAEGADSRILGTAAAGAFEGAAQNAGSYVSDVALGNRDLSAEGFLGAMGKGALYGGVAGGALSVASNGLIAARRLLRSRVPKAGNITATRFGAQRAISDSVDTSTGLEQAGKQAVSQTDRETQQFISDLEQERAAGLQRAAQTRTAEEGALAGPPVDPVTGETTLPKMQPSKDPRELMAAWREKHPDGAVDYDAATAASRRQRLSDWAKDFSAQTPEDATIKAYFSEPMDPMRTAPGDRLGGTSDVPKAVQVVARKAAADASHQAYPRRDSARRERLQPGCRIDGARHLCGSGPPLKRWMMSTSPTRRGQPLVDLRAATTQRLTGQLHELAEARADMIQSLKSPAAGDLMAQLQGTKAAIDAGQPLSLGERILSRTRDANRAR